MFLHFFSALSCVSYAIMKFYLVIYSVHSIRTLICENIVLLLILSVAGTTSFFIRHTRDRFLCHSRHICLVAAALAFSILWFKLGEVLASDSEFLYVYICLVIFSSVSYANCADEDAPRGIWAKWKNLEQNYETWLQLNEQLLKEIVCGRQMSIRTDKLD